MLKVNILLLLLVLSFSSYAKVTSFELDNGLKILVKEDNRSPIVVHQIWYRVGSVHEHNGITGISHMVEHMMFKGTENFKMGEFSEKVLKMGGRENAFVSSDFTAFFQIVGKQHLATVMKMEADRMANLVFDDALFQKERKVVAEERRWRVDDRPASMLFEQFKAVAFLSSPARNPVVGWMEDIQSWQLADLKNWYERWYAPNNATLVVVGDVDPQEVKRLAQKYYGVHARQEIQRVTPQLEIPQIGKRTITIKGNTKLPAILMGFQVPTLVSATNDQEIRHAYALSVLSSILAGDDSARLPRELVRGNKKLASVSTSYRSISSLQTLFTFSMTPSAGITPDEAQQQIWLEIDKLKNNKVSAEELARVLAQAEADYVFGQDSTQRQAMILGSLASVGLPYSTVDDWVKNLRKVSAEDIQEVVKKYFTKDRLTVGVLLPETAKEQVTKPIIDAGEIK